MYTLRDDINIYGDRHQDLLDQSRQSQQLTESGTSLKTRVTRVYKLLLAHAGRKMIAWGSQLHKRSGIATETPLLNPPYAIENRS